MADLKKDVCNHSIELFLEEVITLSKDGWEIDLNARGEHLIFGGYVCSMYRNDVTVEAMRQRCGDIQEAPKMTRAEILEKARAARGKPKLDLEIISN